MEQVYLNIVRFRDVLAGDRWPGFTLYFACKEHPYRNGLGFIDAPGTANHHLHPEMKSDDWKGRL